MMAIQTNYASEKHLRTLVSSLDDMPQKPADVNGDRMNLSLEQDIHPGFTTISETATHNQL